MNLRGLQLQLAIAGLALALAVWPVLSHQVAALRPIPQDDLILSAKLCNTGRYAEAVPVAQRYLKRDPHSAAALINLGFAYAGLKNWDQAVETTQEAWVQQPDSDLAWANLRWMLASQLDAKTRPDALEAKAVDEFNTQDYRDCIEDGEHAVRLFPQYTKAYNIIAACQLNIGRYDEAIANAKEALRLEPNFEAPQTNLRIAQDFKAKGIVPKPPDPAALLNSSLESYRAGRHQDCINYARAALHVDPNSAIAYNNIAACSNDLGRPDDAIEAAMQALRLKPDFQLARNNLMVAHSLKSRQNPQ